MLRQPACAGVSVHGRSHTGRHQRDPARIELDGPALLDGVIWCGRCGTRTTAHSRDRGVHARSVAGVAVLPLHAPVEVEIQVELSDRDGEPCPRASWPTHVSVECLATPSTWAGRTRPSEQDRAAGFPLPDACQPS